MDLICIQTKDGLYIEGGEYNHKCTQLIEDYLYMLDGGQDLEDVDGTYTYVFTDDDYGIVSYSYTINDKKFSYSTIKFASDTDIDMDLDSLITPTDETDEEAHPVINSIANYIDYRGHINT